MDKLSQKFSKLSSVRNGQFFRPVYDSILLSPICRYQRLFSTSSLVTCWEEGTGYIVRVPHDTLVRRVIEAE